jgi:competence protein ComEC
MEALRRHGRWYFCAAFAVTVGAIWSAVFWVEAHRGQLFLHALDVGQGDAILIEAPSGNQVLVDGGPDDTLLARLGAILPFWDRSIDLVILTHPHADHLDGLVALLERYKVGLVLESGVNHSIPEYGQWHEVIRRQGIPLHIARRGQVVRLGGGAELRVLTPFRSFVSASPKNIHDAAVVIKLAFASSTALLMADAESSLERALVAARDNLRAEVLKVGHHGSRTSTSAVLLGAVRPRFAVISVGRRNRYGHPVQEVLDRIAGADVTVFRTDQEGTVTFVGDGQQFTVVER